MMGAQCVWIWVLVTLIQISALPWACGESCLSFISFLASVFHTCEMGPVVTLWHVLPLRTGGSLLPSTVPDPCQFIWVLLSGASLSKAGANLLHVLSVSLQQNKMEDHLDEAIHVLRNHAVGQSNHGDIHGLLASASGHSTSVGSLSHAFPPASVLPIASRHSNLVGESEVWGWE